MADTVSMIMPMAGRGSRFAAQGEKLPKPLIPLAGMPFFWWAAHSVLRVLPQALPVFVVLEEHVEHHNIDKTIRELFPQASIVAIPDVTSGALETSLIGLRVVPADSLIIINDCDHAFGYSRLEQACQALREDADGFLTHFRSTVPHFSFARYNEDGLLERTAEKEAISDRAIAGVYGFRNATLLEQAAEAYKQVCPYPELFVSGVYDVLSARGGRVRGFDLDFHIPFGTPDEFRTAAADTTRLEELRS